MKLEWMQSENQWGTSSARVAEGALPLHPGFLGQYVAEIRQVVRDFLACSVPQPFLLSNILSATDRSDARDETPVVVLEQDLRDIRATLGGDGQAYAALIQRYQQVISLQLWKYTRDPVAHEELVHDVFVEAYRSLPSFGHKAPFRNWLQRIATRCGYRFWKLQAKRRTRASLSQEEWHVLQDREPSFADAHAAAESMHLVLGLLPPRDRLVLTLLYWEQRTIAEAAELTGWSQIMVRVQAHRARGKLKRLLEQEQP